MYKLICWLAQNKNNALSKDWGCNGKQFLDTNFVTMCCCGQGIANQWVLKYVPNAIPEASENKLSESAVTGLCFMNADPDHVGMKSIHHAISALASTFKYMYLLRLSTFEERSIRRRRNNRPGFTMRAAKAVSQRGLKRDLLVHFLFRFHANRSALSSHNLLSGSRTVIETLSFLFLDKLTPDIGPNFLFSLRGTPSSWQKLFMLSMSFEPFKIKKSSR